MARFEEQQMDDEPEKEESADSLFDEEEKEPETPEERLDWLLERRRKIVTEINALRPKEGDSLYKLKIDIFGTGKSDEFGIRDTGFKGEVDDELLRDPTLSNLTVSRKYETMMTHLVRYIISLENQIKVFLKYIKEYNSNWAETLQMCIDFDKDKEKFVKEEMGRFIKDYEQSVDKGISTTRADELIRIYEDAEEPSAFGALVQPGRSDLKPSERVFLRMLNKYKKKFKSDAP